MWVVIIKRKWIMGDYININSNINKWKINSNRKKAIMTFLAKLTEEEIQILFVIFKFLIVMFKPQKDNFKAF